MCWKIQYLPEAVKDFKKLSGNQRLLVATALSKVAENPLPIHQGGYGKPLGNKGGRDLTGFLKIKLQNEGLRIVYKLVRTETRMLIVIIGSRADEQVYNAALHRIHQHEDI